ncbi:DUF6731 family protein [Staphylococcus saprophyticus]|jgi:hypothetical protein|uniref:DUF6731 family protein n=1 Tax=Staphylococcus saprophyticus TaxID=29385 RepID=UPI00124411EF|nr:DUF6731 family protein [Staphylococcus saprophyticus]MBC2921542.1 hypothetical protein [Staphylococcus saprophyticus]MBC2957747.1 hypothetical protein [Staphylococcus saprophyticus]MBC3009844.1 hypothetical protein [Staphylococcus saprophyticus]MBC3023861.1 hypothetical protein [Staphylococcus saprophyticus]MBC3030868.1 hypothetical protein [Staphylococcus saprophyticus]
MENKRIVNFYFYNVFEVTEQLDKEKASLGEMLDHLYDLYNSDYTNESKDNKTEEKDKADELKHIESMAYKDEYIRLINVFKNKHDYYQLTFERLDHIIPNVSKLLGESKQLDLEEDEYIGHQITVLYDDRNHVFMIQRNINSLSPNAVESFIYKLYADKYDSDKHIEFSLISDKRKKQAIHNANEYRDIFIRVTKESSEDLFKRLISTKNRDINIDYFEFKIKAKKTNDEYISRDIAKELINNYEQSDDVEKLLVNAKIDEMDRVSLVDVLSQKLKRQIEFTKNDRSELNTDEVFERMVEVYRNDVVHVLPN